MTKYTVRLSEQDLGEFLDGNQEWMEQYRAELGRRLSQFGEADVEISRNALQDSLQIDGDGDDGFIAETMSRMVSDWSWLQE